MSSKNPFDSELERALLESTKTHQANTAREAKEKEELEKALRQSIADIKRIKEEDSTPLTEKNIPDILMEIDKVSKGDPAVLDFKKLFLSGSEIIDIISALYPKINKCFKASAQVSEKFSVEQHTRYFFQKLSEHQQLYQFKVVIESVSKVLPNVHPLFMIIVALHDIGKSLGPREKQHHFTMPIIEKVLETFGFSGKDIEFARAIVDHDILGILIQRTANPKNVALRPKLLNEAIKQLKERCLKLKNISFHDFFYLQSIFYLSDAGAYPSVFKIMKQAEFIPFAYIPKDTIFQDLSRAFQLDLHWIKGTYQTLTPFFSSFQGKYKAENIILDYCAGEINSKREGFI